MTRGQVLPAAPSRKRAASRPVVSLTAEDAAAEDGLPASKVLLICCGHNDLPHSLHSYFAKEGITSDGFDAANGPQSDPADTFVYDRMMRDVKAGEYAAAYACPDTSLFAKLRSTTGAQRYGNLNELTQAEKEKVRAQNIICTRTAMLLEEMTRLGLPWICQTTATNGKQASILHLDEIKQLISHKQVKHMRGYSALSRPSPRTL